MRNRKKITLRIFKKLALIAIIAGAVIAIYPLFTYFYAWHSTSERLQELESPRLTTPLSLAERDFTPDTEFTGSVIDPRGYPALTLTTCYLGNNYIRRILFAKMIIEP